MKELRCALVAMLFALSSPVAAQTAGSALDQTETLDFAKTGRDFLHACSLPAATDGSDELELCLTYTGAIAAGVDAADYADEYSRSSQVGGPFACVPASIPTERLLAVGLRYIREHPELRNAPAADLLAGAWRKGFPCRSEPKP